MNALVIYDSQFGNTARIAEIIATTLGEFGQARAVHVNEAHPAELAGVDLLILGSPTQAWNQTRAMQTFINQIPSQSVSGLRTACFDTRMHVPRWMQRFAAGQMAKKLRSRGSEPLLPPEGFFVSTKEGPLEDGEAKRAAAWARRLGDTYVEMTMA